MSNLVLFIILYVVHALYIGNQAREVMPLHYAVLSGIFWFLLIPFLLIASYFDNHANDKRDKRTS